MRSRLPDDPFPDAAARARLAPLNSRVLSRGRLALLPHVPPGVGPDSHHRRAELVAPVAGLLAIWRAPQVWSDDDLVATYADMEISGYSMCWAQRPDGESDQPAWMRLLAGGAA